MALLTTKDLTDARLLRLWRHIEAHIDDPEIDMARIQRTMAMSRSNLYRLLISTTGMSATAFVRNVRLVVASNTLLEHPEMSISEVATTVGFGSLSYFSRRFKEAFGHCPAKFRVKKMEEKRKLEHT